MIGKGGSVIRAITEETGATIDISDAGMVKIFSVPRTGRRRHPSSAAWFRDLLERLDAPTPTKPKPDPVQVRQIHAAISHRLKNTKPFKIVANPRPTAVDMLRRQSFV